LREGEGRSYQWEKYSTAIFQEREKRMWRRYQRDKNRRIPRQGKGEGRSYERKTDS
jgi:hypothetical protein